AAQIPAHEAPPLSSYSPVPPICATLKPTRGAPPESTSPSRSPRFSSGVVFGTISVWTPRYFRTRYSRWVHWPPLSTTRTRIGVCIGGEPSNLSFCFVSNPRFGFPLHPAPLPSP